VLRDRVAEGARDTFTGAAAARGEVARAAFCVRAARKSAKILLELLGSAMILFLLEKKKKYNHIICH